MKGCNWVNSTIHQTCAICLDFIICTFHIHISNSELEKSCSSQKCVVSSFLKVLILSVFQLHNSVEGQIDQYLGNFKHNIFLL